MTDTIRPSIRFSPLLHERLAARAEQEGKSLNMLVIQYCERGLADDEAGTHPLARHLLLALGYSSEQVEAALAALGTGG